tara:strand:+ start:11088 stop:11747 length:660 start_codon:yes stop_codon:yes gene_type:complete
MIRKSIHSLKRKFKHSLTSASLQYKDGVVTLTTDAPFQAVEIHFRGNFQGFSMAGSDYYIGVGREKIVIISFIKHNIFDNRTLSLFKFYGNFFPTSCRVVQHKYSSVYADIVRENNTFNKDAKWEGIHLNWENFTDPSINYIDNNNEEIRTFKKGSSNYMENDIDTNLFEVYDESGQRYYGNAKSAIVNNKVRFYKNDGGNIVNRKNILKGKNKWQTER